MGGDVEILLFLTDTLALFILVYTSLRNDVKRPGETLIGPFRYDVDAEPAGAKPADGQPRGAPRPAGPRSGRF